jgi:hypothetical protein
VTPAGASDGREASRGSRGAAIEEGSVTEKRWSASEKKIARRVFEGALKRELGEILAEFKLLAERAGTPAEMWDVEPYLNRARRGIDSKYDFRYSDLEILLGRLLLEERITEADLEGLAADKLESIRAVPEFFRSKHGSKYRFR